MTEGHLSCLKAVIEAGADVNILDEPTGQRKKILEGSSALLCGLVNRHTIYYPDEYTDECDGNDPPQKTALIHVAENGHERTHWLALL